MVEEAERNRLVNVIRMLANLLVLTNFFTFRAYGNTGGWTLENQIIAYVIFAAVLIVVNIFVYYAFYKKPQNQARSASP